MLADLTILIAEDQIPLALDLAAVLEDDGVLVVGPAETVAEGLVLAEQGDIAAAILDANLLDRDITPLALRLIDRGIPFVIYTGTGLPADLASVYPDLPVVMKPALPETVVDALQAAIAGQGVAVDVMPLELPEARISPSSC
jgi:DNA-binding NarL/FixJ family response regulator